MAASDGRRECSRALVDGEQCSAQLRDGRRGRRTRDTETRLICVLEPLLKIEHIEVGHICLLTVVKNQGMERE